MLFLAMSHNTGDPSALLRDEAARTEELQDDGIFQHVFLKADFSGAVIVVDAPDLDQARTAVDSLPLVVNGLTSFTLTALVDPAAFV